MIAYTEHKGYTSGSGGEVVNYEPPIHCGIDLFPWDFSSDEDDELVEPAVSEPLAANTKSKKLSKQQKKQEKQNKKINAARKRRAKREQEIMASQLLQDQIGGAGSSQLPVNVFDLVAKTKAAYAKLLQLSKPEAGKSALATSASKLASSLSSSDYRVLQYKSITIYKSDLGHLLPEEWLCDNNISFVYSLLEMFTSASNNQIYMLFPSLVQLFVHMPYDNVDVLQQLLPKELVQLKLVFIPLNFIDNFEDVDIEDAGGDHWFLCVLNRMSNKLYVYDSMADEGDDGRILQELALRLQRALTKTRIEIVKMKCQQQDNFDDCGVFLVMFTSVLVNRLTRLARAIEDKEVDDIDIEVSLDLSKVQFEPALARFYIMNLVLKLYNRTKSED